MLKRVGTSAAGPVRLAWTGPLRYGRTELSPPIHPNLVYCTAALAYNEPTATAVPTHLTKPASQPERFTHEVPTRRARCVTSKTFFEGTLTKQPLTNTLR